MSPGSAFVPGADEAFARWRDAKLASYPMETNALIVEVTDPRRPRESELRALGERLGRANMVIYATASGFDPDKAIPRRLAAAVGMCRLDHNYLADDDGLSAITVAADDGVRPHFIPYTDRPINWHTDGYYNDPAKRIRAFVLHCVRPAGEGGINGLMDPEMAYLLLREQDPGLVAALMNPAVMTIPAREDEDGIARPDAVGPVFAIEADGSLYMRYTARKRNVVWRDDLQTRAAVAALHGVLEGGSPYVHHLRLEAGMGLLCNNVLHERSGFSDDPGQGARLLYRGRYLDRARYPF